MPTNLPMTSANSNPKAQGLYDPAQEHDACGVGFVVDMKDRHSHKLIEMALEICVNLDHRGGCGCDANTGDGAGMFLQIPDKFFRKEAKALGFTLPEQEHYAVGLVYLSRGEKEQANETYREEEESEHVMSKV